MIFENLNSAIFGTFGSHLSISKKNQDFLLPYSVLGKSLPNSVHPILIHHNQSHAASMYFQVLLLFDLIFYRFFAVAQNVSYRTKTLSIVVLIVKIHVELAWNLGSIFEEKHWWNVIGRVKRERMGYDESKKKLVGQISPVYLLAAIHLIVSLYMPNKH